MFANMANIPPLHDPQNPLAHLHEAELEVPKAVQRLSVALPIHVTRVRYDGESYRLIYSIGHARMCDAEMVLSSAGLGSPLFDEWGLELERAVRTKAKADIEDGLELLSAVRAGRVFVVSDKAAKWRPPNAAERYFGYFMFGVILLAAVAVFGRLGHR